MRKIKNIEFYIKNKKHNSVNAVCWSYYKYAHTLDIPEELCKDLDNIGAYLLGWFYGYINSKPEFFSECITNDDEIIVKNWKIE